MQEREAWIDTEFVLPDEPFSILGMNGGKGEKNVIIRGWLERELVTDVRFHRRSVSAKFEDNPWFVA